MNTQKHDKRIEAYLDGFDDFCDEVWDRYDAEVVRDLTPLAMISFYRGFIAALPSIEKAMVKAEKSA